MPASRQMNADDQTTAQSDAASRRRFRGKLRTALAPVLRPYLRHRAETVTALARLEAEIGHLRERHTEQIERLEDIARELVLTAEALRRALATREGGGEQ
jgi:hypothetical protein